MKISQFFFSEDRFIFLKAEVPASSPSDSSGEILEPTADAIDGEVRAESLRSARSGEDESQMTDAAQLESIDQELLNFDENETNQARLIIGAMPSEVMYFETPDPEHDVFTQASRFRFEISDNQIILQYAKVRRTNPDSYSVSMNGLDHHSNLRGVQGGEFDNLDEAVRAAIAFDYAFRRMKQYQDVHVRLLGLSSTGYTQPHEDYKDEPFQFEKGSVVYKDSSLFFDRGPDLAVLSEIGCPDEVMAAVTAMLNHQFKKTEIQMKEEKVADKKQDEQRREQERQEYALERAKKYESE
ncbi:hypothetical protein HN748_06500 [Candidatus Peregrinibacteria bacterium]|jgi:hypothetical protein|nr:hypothetical protein [Candidatus Peregrinibacteria bacterium]MBT7484281.1 hypothetical protein [Candidatus Peregrinibacteria bacterium]MBT7703852.1 hypothetical protein [Candidatus Peregrinibacteria bacterium]